MKLLLATGNAGKIREFEALLAGAGVTVTTPAREGLSLPVEETGATLKENAALKARAYADASGLPALADDSGLFVDALGGDPGVHSARYGSPQAVTDEDRVQLLLRNVSSSANDDRAAAFRCVIAVALPGSPEIEYATGECRGIIRESPQGNDGFGYDPIFLVPEYGATMAELDRETKNRISHRGRATRAALEIIRHLAGRVSATEPRQSGYMKHQP